MSIKRNKTKTNKYYYSLLSKFIFFLFRVQNSHYHYLHHSDEGENCNIMIEYNYKQIFRFLNVVMYFSIVLFTRNPKMIIVFFEKQIFKKLFNFEIIYFLLNTEETLTLIFRMFYIVIEY